MQSGTGEATNSPYSAGAAYGLRAGLLQRQLIKRFGPLPGAIQRRLDQATSEQLEIWAERILEAPNLPAVFDDH